MVPGLNVSTTTSAPSHSRRNAARPASDFRSITTDRRLRFHTWYPGWRAKGITSGGLDLDDVGTELGEEQDADGSRHAPAEVEHPYTPQGTGRLGHVPVAPVVPTIHAFSSSSGHAGETRHFVDLHHRQDYSSAKILGRVPSRGVPTATAILPGRWVPSCFRRTRGKGANSTSFG